MRCTSESTLGRLINLNYGKGLPEIKRVEGDVPVYGSGGIIGYHKVALIEGPGIVVGRKGTVGSVYWEDRNFFPIDTTYYVTPKSEESNLKFIYYLLVSLPLATLNTDAAVPGLNRDNALQVKINLPPKQAWDKIASILSAYDSLIENNRRRIQLLEQSARLLYREWFIYLRFPGHEHVRIVDGVPEGWEKTNALDIMDVLSGGTPKTSVPDFWDGGIPFFTPKDTTDSPYVYDTEKNITEQGLSNCSSQLYLKDTIFITARGTVGNLNLAQTPMAMNQSCYALIGKEPLTQYFLYCALHAAIEQFKSRAVGAVFDAIIRDTFKHIPFVMPRKKIITDFTEIVTPYFKQIDNLFTQNRKLTTARDILLPRLMNGEITV